MRTNTKFTASSVVKDISWGRRTGMSARIVRMSAIFMAPHYRCGVRTRQVALASLGVA